MSSCAYRWWVRAVLSVIFVPMNAIFAKIGMVVLNAADLAR
jgi:uncharacterized membrane protein